MRLTQNMIERAYDRMLDNPDSEDEEMAQAYTEYEKAFMVLDAVLEYRYFKQFYTLGFYDGQKARDKK